MAILSDRSIKDFIRDQQLILNGKLERVRHCSYNFCPDKVFHSSEDDKSNFIDFSSDIHHNTHDLVKPGEYVWIRMQEFVKLPSDICAFWWQTNTLSRKGLLLMNMSIVEPGYEGPLSCLFVNFSRIPVAINPETSMAKLVFARIDQVAEIPSRKIGTSEEAIVHYDEALYDEALARPATFLQINEEFKRLQEDAIQKIQELKTTQTQMIAELQAETQKLTRDSIKEFSDNIPGAIQKYSVYAAGAIALLVFVSTISPWIQELFSPKVDIESQVSQQVSQQVKQELANWMNLQFQLRNDSGNSLPAAPIPGGDLLQQYQLLQEQYEILEQRLNDLEQSSQGN